MENIKDTPNIQYGVVLEASASTLTQGRYGGDFESMFRPIMY